MEGEPVNARSGKRDRLFDHTRKDHARTARAVEKNDAVVGVRRCFDTDIEPRESPAGRAALETAVLDEVPSADTLRGDIVDKLHPVVRRLPCQRQRHRRVRRDREGRCLNGGKNVLRRRRQRGDRGSVDRDEHRFRRRGLRIHGAAMHDMEHQSIRSRLREGHRRRGDALVLDVQHPPAVVRPCAVF